MARKVVASISVELSEEAIKELALSKYGDEMSVKELDTLVKSIFDKSSTTKVYQKLGGRNPIYDEIKEYLGDTLFEVIEDMARNRSPFEFDVIIHCDGPKTRHVSGKIRK